MGARIVPFAGRAMPVQYTGIVDEHKAVRNAAGVFDVSHMGELSLRGEYATHVVDYLVTNDAKKLADGQAMYTCACNEQGTILDDLIVYSCAARRLARRLQRFEPRKDERPLRPGREIPLRLRGRERRHCTHRSSGPSGIRSARRHRR